MHGQTHIKYTSGRNMLIFKDKGLLACSPTSNLENQHLPCIRDSLFNTYIRSYRP